MRTTMLFLAAGAAALGACKWTEFDDLQNQTWVGSTEKPNVKSSDYGVAIQRGKPLTDGGTLVVIGANQPTYSELAYDANGGSKLTANTLELNSQYGIGTLDTQPILLADPTTDDIALVVNGGGSQILVLTGAGQLNMHNLFVNPSTVDAATYMLPPGSSADEPLVASGDVVVGTFYGTVPNPQPTCKLTDSGTAIQAHALGVVRTGAAITDDVIAWGSAGAAAGKLYRYPGSVFNGCAPAGVSTTGHDTGFVPGRGSQILTIDPSHVLLQGHHDADDTSLLQVYDATLSPVGGSVSLPRLRSAAILDTGSQKYVIAGYPGEIVGGTAAGVVRLFKVSAAGIESQPTALLNDAQPENGESFGRAVAAVPFKGKPVVAVAANNEIFMYFRLNTTDGTSTPIYGETRQGR
ncbi:MAG TPA: hypothetical protein VF516_32150 [Kofleriaceae bacterium]